MMMMMIMMMDRQSQWRQCLGIARFVMVPLTWRPLWRTLCVGRLAVDARNGSGYTLLMEAAHVKHLGLIEALLVRRANVASETVADGSSALFWACLRSHSTASTEAGAVQAAARLLASWPGDRDWRSGDPGPMAAALLSRWYVCALWLLGQGTHLPSIDAWQARRVEMLALAAGFRGQVSDALVVGSVPGFMPAAVCGLIAAYVV